MRKFFKEFKQFITKGNILDMAVGVIIGSAFSNIVTALTNKILMPLINALLAMGGNGLESAYTYLKIVYLEDGSIDLANSIFIDWGAFITAIINFFLIALVLFTIIKVMMNAKGYVNKAVKAYPTRAERKELKSQGVDLKDLKDVVLATEALRESKKPVVVEEPAKPTQEELLAQILVELQKSNEKKESKPAKKAEVEE